MPHKILTLDDSVDRLDSWKAIANHLKRGVRSVRLWERREGLPVHRLFHHRRSSVYAFRTELDCWLAHRRPRQSTASSKTVVMAFVPIHELEGDPLPPGLAAGLTEELITQLVRADPARLTIVVSDCNEAPRCVKPGIGTSKGRVRSDFVFSGAVRAVKGEVRATVRLTNARSQAPVWAEGYQLSPLVPLAGQVRVAASIAAEVRRRMVSVDGTALPLPSSRTDAARALCLSGRALCKQRTIHGLRKAIECFEQALDLQPAHAPAYSGLADSYTLLGYYSSFPLPQAQLCATRAARRAIELDDSLSEAHASMGEIKAFYDWDWAGGDQEFQRAIALDAESATTYHWYANLLSILGRTREAVLHGLRAIELEPRSPLIMTGIGLVHLYCNEPDMTIVLCKRALQIDPNYALGYWALGLAYEQIGNTEEALRQFERGKQEDPESTYLNTSLAYTHATAGSQQHARSLLEEMTHHSQPNPASAYDLALLHSGLNEPNDAFRWLEHACQDRSDWMPYLAVEHRFDGLRRDTRYASLLSTLGLHRPSAPS